MQVNITFFNHPANLPQLNKRYEIISSESERPLSVTNGSKQAKNSMHYPGSCIISLLKKIESD